MNTKSLLKKEVMIVVPIFVVFLILGCTSQTPETTGNFVLLISDAEADINDFDSLLVTFSKARIFSAGNGSESGFEEILFNATVDITKLVGEKAIKVFEINLNEGIYSKIELYASEVNGIVNGTEVLVTIPSEKLQITKSFEIKINETTKFVFDINVVKKGHEMEYNLLPVISESGTVGEDIPDQEFNETECTINEDCKEDETCTENGACVEIEEEPEIEYPENETE
jgi:hypothetical protein